MGKVVRSAIAAAGLIGIFSASESLAATRAPKVVLALYTDSDNGRNLLDVALFDNGRLVYDVGVGGDHTYVETRYSNEAIAVFRSELDAVLSQSSVPSVDPATCPTDVGVWFVTLDARRVATLDSCGSPRRAAVLGFRDGLVAGSGQFRPRKDPVKAKFTRYTIRHEKQSTSDFDPTFDVSTIKRWRGDPLPRAKCSIITGGRKTRSVEYARDLFRVASKIEFIELVPTVETRIDGLGPCSQRG